MWGETKCHYTHCSRGSCLFQPEEFASFGEWYDVEISPLWWNPNQRQQEAWLHLKSQLMVHEGEDDLEIAPRTHTHFTAREMRKDVVCYFHKPRKEMEQTDISPLQTHEECRWGESASLGSMFFRKCQISSHPPICLFIIWKREWVILKTQPGQSTE